MAGPVMVMVHEHGQLWRTLDALEHELGTRRELDSITKVCQRLGELETNHNPKEEQILYPQADGVLSSAATAELRALLESGAMPKDWRCEAVRG